MRDNRAIADRVETQTFQDLVSEMVARGIRFRFQATGRSMHPVIQDGDIVHVEPTKHFRVGDVVLFRANAEYKVHRIIRRNTEKVTTRGDSSKDADDPVDTSCILGKVVARTCATTGRVIPIEGVTARLEFHLRQARRTLAMTARNVFPAILFNAGTRQ